MAKKSYFKPLADKFLIRISLRDQRFIVFTADRTSPTGISTEYVNFTDLTTDSNGLLRECENLCKTSKLLNHARRKKWKDVILLLPTEMVSYFSFSVLTSKEKESSPAVLKTYCADTDGIDFIKMKQFNGNPNSVVHYQGYSKVIRGRSPEYKGKSVKDVFAKYMFAVTVYAATEQAQFFGIVNGIEGFSREISLLLQVEETETVVSLAINSVVVCTKVLEFGHEILTAGATRSFRSYYEAPIDLLGKENDTTYSASDGDYAYATIPMDKTAFLQMLDATINGMSLSAAQDTSIGAVTAVIVKSTKNAVRQIRDYLAYKLNIGADEKKCEAQDGVKYRFMDEDNFIPSDIFKHPEINGAPYTQRE